MQQKQLPGLVLAFMTQSAFAQTENTLPSISVQGAQQILKLTGKLKDDVVQTEVLGQAAIERKQAASLTQAIQNEPGVQVSTECSICGAKRITLNGLKGEHTTLLIDGVPNSSILEGFYGYDAIPTAAISRIEISRGAGAALITPEAIGGSVNVISERPQQNESMLDIAFGSDGYQKFQLRNNVISADKRTRMLIAGQRDNIDQYDQDNNQISESPKLENHALIAKIWHDISDKDSFTLRLADQHSEVFGGPMLGSNFAPSRVAAISQPPTGNLDLVGDQTDGQPVTNSSARDWLENILSHKQELTLQWNRILTDDWNSQFTASYVTTEMDAIYSDMTYRAEQTIQFIDLQTSYFASNQHFFTFGFDYKLDTLHSGGSVFDLGGTNQYQAQTPGDAYQNQQIGGYIRDVWTPSHKWEISTALRLDQLHVIFSDQANRLFSEALLSPRLHARYQHDLNYTSRLAIGRGYRAPLQFFESEHGLLTGDSGFDVAVDKLETADSARYSLSFEGAQTEWTTNLSYTQVHNMAKIEDRGGTPTLFNTDGSASVAHIDFSVNYQLNGHWSVGANIEHFEYDQAYRNTLVTLPIEQRLRLLADYEGHGWIANFTLSAISERKFSRYQHADYLNHYDDTAQTRNKGTSAPAFYTVDTRLSREINRAWSIYAGVNNLFDYTQTRAGASPLYYDNNGDLDVTHIWGPLRSRLLYAGTQLKF